MDQGIFDSLERHLITLLAPVIQTQGLPLSRVELFLTYVDHDTSGMEFICIVHFKMRPYISRDGCPFSSHDTCPKYILQQTR